MVGFWFVPLVATLRLGIASPVAWFFACFFLIFRACTVVRKRLQRKDIEKEHDARTINAARMFAALLQGSFFAVLGCRVARLVSRELFYQVLLWSVI